LYLDSTVSVIERTAVANAPTCHFPSHIAALRVFFICSSTHLQAPSFPTPSRRVILLLTSTLSEESRLESFRKPMSLRALGLPLKKLLLEKLGLRVVLSGDAAVTKDQDKASPILARILLMLTFYSYPFTASFPSFPPSVGCVAYSP
jgi:hypothetical protein